MPGAPKIHISVATKLIEVSPAGLFCPVGGFYIDPWAPVDRAVVTHAHSDHARPGSRAYLAAAPGQALLRARLGPGVQLRPLAYGEALEHNGVRVSLHPAGHVLGAAQVRLEHRGEIVVVGGDYKRQGDPTCAPFEVVTCHTFVTEATFALPVYRWAEPDGVCAEIHAWWRANQAEERTSVLFGYAIGKSQRLLAGLDTTIGPVAAHGAVLRFLPAYAEAGVHLPAVGTVEELLGQLRGRGLVLAPPSAAGSPWLRKFGPVSTACASGWMQIRGARRGRALDRGFVLSDHADWRGVLETVRETGASHIGVTHGYTSALARWLREQGYAVTVYPTRFGDGDEVDAEGGVTVRQPAVREAPA